MGTYINYHGRTPRSVIAGVTAEGKTVTVRVYAHDGRQDPDAHVWREDRCDA